MDFQYEEAQQQITIHRMWHRLREASFWSFHEFAKPEEASRICREKLNIPSFGYCSGGKLKPYVTCKSVLQFKLEGFNKVEDLDSQNLRYRRERLLMRIKTLPMVGMIVIEGKPNFSLLASLVLQWRY